MSSLLPPEGEHLTTGWEPDVAPDDTVVRQAVLAHASWAVDLPRNAGRPWQDGPAWAAGYIGDRSPMANWAVLKSPVDDWAAVLAEIQGFFAPGVPHLLLSPWPTPDLSSYGLGLVGHPPLMWRPTSTRTDPPRTTAALRWVDRAEDLVVAERTFVDGYPLPELQPFVAGALLTPSILGSDTRVVLAHDGTTPLATATAHRAHGVTVVENVAVLPVARGRGLGAAVTWAATVADPDQPAVLIASDDGQPVYERLGYLRLERWTVWIRT